jgi:tyrosyl-tRNA synthetase
VASPGFPTAEEQLATIRRGAADIIVVSELRDRLERGQPLRVKLGLDPSAPDLHLGHAVVLQKLRDFQELGHEVIIIIGDFTGMIGDPTGRSETRKQLTRDEVFANAETYRAQLGRVLDLERARLEFNSRWLSRLTFGDLIRETAQLTVAQMLQREDFAARYAAGRPISLHEFLYPVAQAYDSVALEVDVEVGGTDQTFNLLVGRDLQRAHGQEPQVAVTVPILPGLDGVQKMSKSLGNAVGLTDRPGEMYGKLMSVSDETMWVYFELLTRVTADELARLRAGHPMDAKKRLARIVTAQFHGEPEAAAAESGFHRVFQERGVPREEDLDEVRLELGAPGDEPAGPAGSGAEGRPGKLLRLVLREAGFVPSTSEARRRIVEGAVDVDRARVVDVNTALGAGVYLIRVGRRFKRVRIEPGKAGKRP